MTTATMKSTKTKAKALKAAKPAPAKKGFNFDLEDPLFTANAQIGGVELEIAPNLRDVATVGIGIGIGIGLFALLK